MSEAELSNSYEALDDRPAVFPVARPVELSLEAAQAAPDWGPVKRILFRFAFAYLLLYSLPFPLDFLLAVIPKGEVVLQPYTDLWNAIVPWVGKLLFHVKITVQPNGSGDTTYNYVQVLCYLALSAAVALVWTLLDRRRRNYARLYQWLRVYVRFVLASSMLSYGAYKVIKSQFPAPSLDRLLEPYGDSSPMGLLWTFMGASKAYTIFGGFAEMLGGALLTVRRTTLLGALVCIGVITNIVMLNFSYDVPVKLYSTHLLLMAIFLAAPDARRLVNLFVLNRGVEPAADRPLFARKRFHHGALVFRTLFVLLCAGFALNQSYQGSRQYGDLAPRSPLYGVWNVESFELDGQVHPPLLTDAVRWRRVVFDRPRMVGIQDMNGVRSGYVLKPDAKPGLLSLTKMKDPKWKSLLSYRQTAPGLLALEGTLDGHKLRATLRRTDTSKLLLVNRGFHWINEFPFNR